MHFGMALCACVRVCVSNRVGCPMPIRLHFYFTLRNDTNKKEELYVYGSSDMNRDDWPM